MAVDKITKRFTDYKSKEDTVPVLSREFNLLVDAVNAAEESSDISLKANIAGPTFTGFVTIPAPGVAEGLKIGATAITPTAAELNYVSGVTSAVQTQLNAKAPAASPTFTGTVTLPDVTMNGHKNAQLFLCNAFNCPAPGTGWTPSAKGVTLPASQTGAKVWIPLNFLKVGDEIVDYYLVGDAQEAAALTLDCKLITVSKGDPLSQVDVAGGGIVQITTDGTFDVNATLSAVETVAVDTGYFLEISGTTGIGDGIDVCHAMFTINRK